MSNHVDGQTSQGKNRILLAEELELLILTMMMMMCNDLMCT